MIFPQDTNEEPRTQPAGAGQRNPPYPPLAVDFPERQGRTVILIEQNTTIIHMIQQTLRREHIKVIVADNALEGLVNIAQYQPQLILLSTQMPRLDGYQLCTIIRKNPQLARVPVIMLGNQANAFTTMRSRLVGSTEFLPKPFRFNELIRIVKKYIPENSH